MEDNLNLATSAKIYYTKPDGTTGSWTATLGLNDIDYTLQSGDILSTDTGVWLLQGEVTWGSATVKTQKVTLDVV